MNQLKKILFALAVAVSLGLVGASNAHAQLACSSTAGNPIVRSEGISELVGTITLTCQEPGGSPATAPTSITITLLPAAATITNSPATPPTVSIDNAAGVAGAIGGNTVTFAVPAFAACAAVAPATCLHTIIVGINPNAPAASTVGMRVNIFSSGITFPAAVRELTTTPTNGVITLTNSQLDVATPQPGLSAAAFTAGIALAQCATALLPGTPTVATFGPGTTSAAANVFAAANPNTGAAVALATRPVVTVTEGFPTSFQVAAGEGTDATQGTRIIFRFVGLPSNTGIVAPNVVTQVAPPASTLTLTLVTGADVNGTGALTAPGPGGATVITGTSVTYEVTATSNAVQETIGVPFGVFTFGTPSPSGASTVSVALAPISTVLTPIATPIPRFGDRAISGALVSVIPCLSNIFFPWVANVAGYDTGFAVSNTTTDIFGTASQSGTCVYNFFGSNGPAGGTFTTPAFGGGNTNTQLLSVIAPGFSGYVIIQCNFQLGHGFNFIVNGFGGGSPTVGQGGPGLIIGQPGATGGTSRRAFASIGPPFGEALGH